MSASDPIKIYRNPLREFKSARSAQRFLGLHAAAYNTFNLQRHLISRSTLRIFRLSVVQGFRDNGLGKLREALAHRIGEVRRPAVGAASGG